MTEQYKFLDHTADVKFQAFGKTVEEVFTNSALAMFHVMYKGKIRATQDMEVSVEGNDLVNLLYNFLEEFLFLFDSRNFLASTIKKIKLRDKPLTLRAEVVGDDAKNYEINLGIKAVTYHDMFVRQENNQWITQVVLDV